MTDATPDNDAPVPEDAAAEAARLCKTCQAPLADDQEWCLSCGRAVAGRSGRLPGMRAAGTVAALTLALTGGAVAASYAALTDDPPPPAATTQVAQVPQTTTTTVPAAATPPATDTTPTTPAPADGGDAGASSLPDLSDVPSTPDSGATDDLPADDGTSSGGSDGGSSTSSSTTDDETTGSTRSHTSTTTAKDPSPIKLDAASVAVYDPYARATAQGDVGKLLDGDGNTSWFVTAPDGAGHVNVGLVVDLGKRRGVRELDLVTKTPGFKTEIYATDSDELPPDVLDTRWAHLKDVGDVGSGADGAEVITLGAGSTKYRYLLLWFTAPPAQGTTVRLPSLTVLG